MMTEASKGNGKKIKRKGKIIDIKGSAQT